MTHRMANLYSENNIKALHKQQDIVQHIGHTISFSHHLVFMNVIRLQAHSIFNDDCILHKNNFHLQSSLGWQFCVCCCCKIQKKLWYDNLYFYTSQYQLGCGVASFLSNTELIDYYISFSF